MILKGGGVRKGEWTNVNQFKFIYVKHFGAVLSKNKGYNRTTQQKRIF